MGADPRVFLESLLRDFQYAARLLRRSLGFTGTAVAVLALGIGANTAIFSVVNRVILQPLPYPQPDRLVQLYNQTVVGPANVVSLSRYALWRSESQAFELMAAYDLGQAEAKPRDAAEKPLHIAHVSADFFPVFGAPMTIGRSFNEEEDRPGGAPVAIISEQLWRRRFHGDLTVLGRSLALDDRAYEIVGVIRAGFASDPPADVWLPLQVNPFSADHSARIRVAARNRPGVDVSYAAREIGYLTNRFESRFPRVLGPRERFGAKLLRDFVIGDVGPSLLMLSGAVVFVLLIACANVANLLMARSARRGREIATRAALGASRWRLIAQLLSESALLATLGGAAGLWVGHAGLRVLLAMNPPNLPRLADAATFALDPRVIWFTLALTAATGVLFGLIPAFAASRVDLSTTLNRAAVDAPGQTRTRRFLVAAETALALVLVIGCGLLIRTFIAMHTTDRGFDASNVLTLEMPLGSARFEKTAAVADLIRQATLRLGIVPGIQSFAAASSVPLEPGGSATFTIDRRPLLGAAFHGATNWRAVTAQYFDVFRVPLRRGRVFSMHEDRGVGDRVILINNAMASKYWSASDPIGQSLSIDRTFRGVIIGVVANVRDTGLDRPAEPIVYLPAAQLSDEMNAVNQRTRPLTWTIRTIGDPWILAGPIQRELREASGAIPLGRVRSMEDIVSESTSRARFTLTLLTTFALIALTMAAVGIYGLVSYSVEQRTREFGIRVAIGATPGRVRNLVLGESLRLAMLGISAGVIGATWLTEYLTSAVYGVATWDLTVYASATALLAIIAISASILPAIRATRVDPLVALRND